MSEALDRVRGIEQLPIFPLPLVMLPNEFLPLHIFEDRYRRMLDDIGQIGGKFGITLFEPKDAVLDRPDAGTVGCVAEIREIETLPDGRSNIISFGIVRYRLLEYVDAGTPYLVGAVHFFEDEPAEPGALQPLADEVFGLFERIAKAAYRMSGSRGRLPEIPQTDPQSFSFLATAAFSFENELKYKLLEMTSTAERLEKLREILPKIAGQMEESADIHLVSKTNGHSKKKLDI